jgi:hypothetical protein
MGSGRSMGIMAIATDDLAFQGRMPVGPIGFGTFVLMALIADIGLFTAIHDFAGFMYEVATGTGEVFIFMDAGLPLEELVALVATHAHGILKFRGCGVLTDIGDHGKGGVEHMFFAGTVTGLATAICEGGVCITDMAVFSIRDLLVMVLMALGAVL